MSSFIMDEKPHHSYVCNKSYRKKSQLNERMLIHSGEKPHQCDQCGKSFNCKSLLAKHILVHSGEKTIPVFSL